MWFAIKYIKAVKINGEQGSSCAIAQALLGFHPKTH